MVYHHPAEQRWQNKVPVLRLFLSDSAATNFLRFVPTVVISTALYIVGGTVVALYAPWPPAAHSMLAMAKEQLRGPRSRIALGCAVGAFVLHTAVSFTVQKWTDNVKPNRAIKATYDFFRTIKHQAQNDEELEAERKQWADTPGIALDLETNCYVIHPTIDVETATTRAFNTVGMTLYDFATIHFTVGVEYAATAWTRIFRHGFCGLLGWYEPVSAVDRRRLYQLVLNTSLVCFAHTVSGDFDEHLGTEVGGHVVLEHVRMPYGDVSHRTFRKIVVFMDHEAMEIEKVVCVYESDTDLGTQITTWGSRDHCENSEYDKISQAESVHQAGLILGAAVATYTHGSMHWWASAVAAMPFSKWPGAAESTRITQWTNTQAVLSSGIFIGNNMMTCAMFLVYNARNGLPVHGVKPKSSAAPSPRAASRTDARRRSSVTAMQSRLQSEQGSLAASPRRSLAGSPVGMGPRSASSFGLELAREPSEFFVAGMEREPLRLESTETDEHGLPKSKHLFTVLGERSTFHQLSVAAGAALKKYFDAKNAGVSAMQARAITAATVQHSIEHFLLGELGPMFTEHQNCMVLRTDLSGLFQCLVYPTFYVSRPRLTLRLRRQDEVAQVIYRACVEREQQLIAENAEAKARGKPPIFPPLKNYCDDYLHVGCSV